MISRLYTILIVPERSAKVRRLKISHQRLVQLAFAGVGLLALATFMSVHYAFIVSRAAENTALKARNLELRTQLRGLQEEIVRIDVTLQRIDQFATRVRAITQLNDPARNLAMGPVSTDPNGKTPEVLYAKGERIEFEDEILDSKLAMRLADASVDATAGESVRQQDNMRQLHDALAEQDLLLATTPSIRPTASRLLISGFGARTDPYTDQQVMHKGIDFAADLGAQVMAPADGLVVFVGNRGSGYGKTVVIDHGYAMQTHYAHLAEFKVEVGQMVRRGQGIASVGNTGRTTGAHLHYEVRFDGIPQDPERFILD